MWQAWAAQRASRRLWCDVRLTGCEPNREHRSESARIFYEKRKTRERVNSSALRSNDRLTVSGLKIVDLDCVDRIRREKTGANIVYSYGQENIFYVYISIVFCPRDYKNNITRSYITNLSQRIYFLYGLWKFVSISLVTVLPVGSRISASRVKRISGKQVCEEASGWYARADAISRNERSVFSNLAMQAIFY